MPYKFREIHKRLTQLGFSIVRQGKGSHVIFSNGRNVFPVPNHGSKDISKGVEIKICKILGLTTKEFRELL